MIDSSFPFYNLMLILAIAISDYIIYYFCKREKYSNFELLCLIVYVDIFMIYFGKYFTLFSDFTKYSEYKFIDIVMSSYGCLIGIFVALYIYKLQFKKDFSKLFNICLMCVPLMYSLGKIGCFLVGCCYGIEFNSWFSVTYNYSMIAPKGVSLFPVQAIESFVFLVIFFVYLYLFKKNKINKNVILIFISVSAFFKFILDYFRMSHVTQVLSINQIVSVIFIVFCITFIFINKRKSFKN